MRPVIIECNGSIQKIPVIPRCIKALYKTFWEINMKTVLDTSISRQAFIDRSQSLNIYFKH